jgi:hypothetical protein
MRVTRSLMLLLAVAFAAAGCAQQPVMRVQMAAAPQGIDNVIYGPAPAYGTAAAPASGTAAARGYFALPDRLMPWRRQLMRWPPQPPQPP